MKRSYFRKRYLCRNRDRHLWKERSEPKLAHDWLIARVCGRACEPKSKPCFTRKASNNRTPSCYANLDNVRLHNTHRLVNVYADGGYSGQNLWASQRLQLDTHVDFRTATDQWCTESTTQYGSNRRNAPPVIAVLRCRCRRSSRTACNSVKLRKTQTEHRYALACTERETDTTRSARSTREAVKRSVHVARQCACALRFACHTSTILGLYRRVTATMVSGGLEHVSEHDELVFARE